MSSSGYRKQFWSSVLIGMVAIFLLVALGCGSGFLPSATMMHKGIEMCSNMLIDTLVMVKEVGGVAMILVWSLMIVVAVVGLATYKWLSIDGVAQRLAGNKNAEAKVFDIVLQALSAGILQPKIY